MTDKVINALKCISGEDVYCEECSYSALYRYNFCIKRCAKDAIDLINRFKRESKIYKNQTKALTEELEALGDPLQDAHYKIAEQQAEIERLLKLAEEQNAEIKRLQEARNKLLYGLKQICKEQDENNIRAEAINEFAERLKKEVDFIDTTRKLKKTIDNLVKEMVGDVE